MVHEFSPSMLKTFRKSLQIECMAKMDMSENIIIFGMVKGFFRRILDALPGIFQQGMTAKPGRSELDIVISKG
ncbi:MAG: hypothetical protein SWH61_10720 [Thermodesulfobacteriota bacterium]|nr:hypothetical protein [Thermodesulfobacteriota bacterium]